MSPRARDYQPGQRLPGTVYEVVRAIGAGGMGTVYDVEDTTIGKRYVLKTLHPQLGDREDLARRMQNEARTLARLNHPNIVEVITAGVTGDDLRLPYYVMERLNGQSLRVVLEKKGELELPHAVHIAIDLLDALDHAHDKGVIHRDVKPDNIFLHRTSAGVTVTKLLDFGILSFLDSTMNETAGRFLGTLRYAAPEQLRGEQPTPKVDIYAAGLVLYEMIAGRGPFDEEGDTRSIGAAHMEKLPPRLSSFASVPSEVESLVMAALAKAPEERPRDAFSFAAKLREFKRALSPVGGSPQRDATTGRANTAAVIGQESALAAYVEVRHPSPDGPYVIAPARDGIFPAQNELPKTTLRGFTPPTLGPSHAPGGVSAVSAVEARTSTTPEVVDRRATTHSLVPPTVAAPPHGTEPLPPSSEAKPRSFRGVARSGGDSPLRWPAERPPAPSDEPQVQTVTAAIPRRLRWAPRMVAASAMLGATGAAIALVLVGPRLARDRVVLPVATAMTTPALQSATSQAPSVAIPDHPVQDPTITTEAARDSEAPSPPLRASAPAKRIKQPAHEASVTRAASSPLHTDRPGPGF
jgi:serine/threonine protein kinase